MEQTQNSVALERRTALFTWGDVTGAAIAGLLAGGVMGVVAMIIGGFYTEGISIWTPLKQVSASVYGLETVTPEFAAGPVIIGLLIHSVVSVVLGVVFALLYRRVFQLPFQLGLPFLVGGIYGIAVWGVAHIILPAVNPVMAEADKPAFVLGHLAFGVSIGLFYSALHPDLPRQDGG